MFTIHLKDLRLFAHHGLFAEESVTGTEFLVSLSVNISDKPMMKIDDTVNYVKVYEVIRRHFAMPYKLLETLAQEIVSDVYALHESINLINITISKLNAPIDNFTGIAGISYSKSFS